MTSLHINTEKHPITDAAYISQCRAKLSGEGALVLTAFAVPETIAKIVDEFADGETNAYYARNTHNVYLTPISDEFAADHPYNHQIVSSKGLIADDEVPVDSPLREIYNDSDFRNFLCGTLGIANVYPYADDLSSINVHYAAEGMELGWHFDNSSFAVTMLLQAADGGARFEHVPRVRDSDVGDMAFERVAGILAGEELVRTLEFEPGDLVLFKGRDALHRVTPTEGDTTRILVVFAYNDQPGVALSDSALATFYGRMA